MTYQELNFRAVYHRLVAVTLNDSIKKSAAGYPGIEEGDVALTYGYIDPEKGVSLELLCVGRITEQGFQFYNGYPKKNVHIRIGAVVNEQLYYLEDPDGSLQARFRKKICSLSRFDPSEGVERSRTMAFLDPSRDRVHIDEVFVVLSKDGLREETVKTRISGLSDHYFVGVLLDEPKQDFGFHVGEQIVFYVLERDGGVVCYTDLTPDRTLSGKDMEDGSLLKEAVLRFNEERTEERLLDLLQFLRDSRVFVPCSLIPDPDHKESPGYFVPEIMESDGKRFMPVFSDREEMQTYQDRFSIVRRDLTEMIGLAKNEESVEGIVLNPFTVPFVLSRGLFDTVRRLKSRIV